MATDSGTMVIRKLSPTKFHCFHVVDLRLAFSSQSRPVCDTSKWSEHETVATSQNFPTLIYFLMDKPMVQISVYCSLLVCHCEIYHGFPVASLLRTSVDVQGKFTYLTICTVVWV